MLNRPTRGTPVGTAYQRRFSKLVGAHESDTFDRVRPFEHVRSEVAVDLAAEVDGDQQTIDSGTLRCSS